MENNINSKHNSNIMKTIFTMFLMLMLLMTSGFSAISYNDIQNETIIGYNTGSVLSSSTPSLAFNGMSSVTYNFKLTDTPMYLVLSASDSNPSENITITRYNDILGEFLSSNYNIPKDDIFILELIPNEIGDQTTLILTNATGNIAYSYVFMNNNLRGVEDTRTIYTPIINSLLDLLQINISIWKIGYYVLIMGLVLGAIGGLVLLGFTYYTWAEKHKMYKNRNTRK